MMILKREDIYLRDWEIMDLDLYRHWERVQPFYDVVSLGLL